MRTTFKHSLYGAALMTGLLMGSCKKGFLDVVPDNIATIETAFSNKTEAEKYLRTCYSFLPSADPVCNIRYFGADDMWTYSYNHEWYQSPWKISMGMQNAANPLVDFWNGSNHGKAYFIAIRECNIFLENMLDGDKYRRIPYLSPDEQKRWIAEVKFLKAYYHFYLLKMYGPIPITDVNLPLNAPPEAVRVTRQPVDEVTEYIVSTLDQVIPDLPESITDRAMELGRITKPIAQMLKAQVLMAHASPLFNGNADFAAFKDKKGSPMFSPAHDPARWSRALKACEEAIQSCAAAGIRLYEFNNPFVQVKEATRIHLSVNGAITEKENPEVIWPLTGRVNDTRVLQIYSAAPSLTRSERTHLSSYMSPTMKMIETYYSENGVPINEDKTWNFAGRYEMRTVPASEKLVLQEGYTTVGLHFHREPRFYANIAFDGGKWFLQANQTDDNASTVQAKMGQPQGKATDEFYNTTGYWVKKFTNFRFTQTNTDVIVENYAWPEMRLADLYLMYAECLNETGKGAEAINYLDKIRTRAGLKGVAESWTQFSNRPAKFTTQEGLRDIIHQERMIELAFEGARLWDLRRWKKALIYMNQPVEGWDIFQSKAPDYYRKKQLFAQKFVAPRDYFWPIREHDIVVNPNLQQTPGW
ncbi:RagB/SusD family nutrient uptake outer membrane protein [Chitinophaga sp. NPDC101104]|uniref:RagB/SusD family nutrient uptake outer membrane protein n=1 Tax=Chitinophaga sp. NPDC101104 TaxID=3390561 RepID=UPI003D047224